MKAILRSPFDSSLPAEFAAIRAALSRIGAADPWTSSDAVELIVKDRDMAKTAKTTDMTGSDPIARYAMPLGMNAVEIKINDPMRNALETEKMTCFLVSSTIFFDQTKSKADEPIPLAAHNEKAAARSKPGEKKPTKQTIGLNARESVLRRISPLFDAKKRANRPKIT